LNKNMDRVEILLFRKNGQRIEINLEYLVTQLCNSFSHFVKIRYENNTLYFCTIRFELSFPKQGNRFSISAESGIVISLIKIITSIYENQNLLVSTPGYEKFIEATYPEDQIKKFLGL
jgi:hypothetical protein